VVANTRGPAPFAYQDRPCALGGVGVPATCVVDSPVGPVLTAEACVIQQIDAARYYRRRGRGG
jgi:hypothetical protein